MIFYNYHELERNRFVAKKYEVFIISDIHVHCFKLPGTV